MKKQEVTSESVAQSEISPQQAIDAQIQDLKDQLQKLEQDPAYSVSVKKVDETGKLQQFSSEEERERQIIEAENQIRALEKQKQTLGVDTEITSIKDTIKEYEEAIKAIESGKKLNIKIQKNELGASYDSVDQLHQKIVDAENQIRELENKKNGVPKKENKAEELPLNENIAQVKSFDELFALLKDIEKIEGSSVEFTGEELIIIISKVRDAVLNPNYVTRTHGLRDAVVRLLGEESSKSAEPIPESPEPEAPDEGQNPEHDPTIPPPLPEEYFKRLKENSIENILDDLDDARMKYVVENNQYMAKRKNVGLIARLKQKLIGIKPEEEQELPEELKEAKDTYDAAKIRLGRHMIEKERESLEEQGFVDVEDRLKAFKAVHVFDRVVLEEHVLLEKFKAESWPPKEANIFMKGLKWYANQSRLTKLAIGGLFAGGGALAGGIAFPTAALFAGAAMVRGVVATGAGILAGKGFEKFIKDKSDPNFNEAVLDMQERFGEGELDLEATEEFFRQASEDRDKQKARYNLLKHAVIAGAAFATSFGLSKLESALNTPPPAPKPVPPSPAPNPNPAPSTPPFVGPPTPPPFVGPSVPTEVVVGGANDNMWAIIKNQLMLRNGEFAQMGEAAQTDAIDTIWRKVLQMDPNQLKSIGITSGDAHRILDGQVIKLDTIINQPNITEAVSGASNLTAGQSASILYHNGYLRNALSGYKGSVDTDLVNRLIKVADSNR